MSTQTKLIFTALLALCAALMLPTQAEAQYYGYLYTYDASGARTTRMYSQNFVLGQAKRGDTTETKTLVGSYEVSIFPNPTRNLLKLNIAGLKADLPAQVSIIDMSGIEIFNKQFRSSENIVDFSSYPNGVYLMTLLIGDKSETYKVMKSD